MESAFLTLVTATVVAYGPAYIANMAPPLAKALGLPGAVPIAAKTLGNHKTYRGLVAGVLGGVLGALVVRWIGWPWFADQPLTVVVATGALIGLMAMVGDAAKSAIKRSLGVAPGQPFIPWDQLDFIVGASMVMFPLGIVDWPMALTAIVITPVLHLIVNVGAYLLGIKDVWW